VPDVLHAGENFSKMAHCGSVAYPAQANPDLKITRWDGGRPQNIFPLEQYQLQLDTASMLLAPKRKRLGRAHAVQLFLSSVTTNRAIFFGWRCECRRLV